MQLYATSPSRCEATAAKINGHADYAGAPTIGCKEASACHVTPLYERAVLAGAALLVAPSDLFADMVAPYFNLCYARLVGLVGWVLGCK